VQRLARVDVAEPGDNRLIEQGDFDCTAAARAGGGERRGVEIRGQWLRAESGHM
jgi:hypothetical protein